MQYTRRKIGITLVILAWTVVIAEAQSGVATGEIQGTVRDPSGLPILGVQVRVINSYTGIQRAVSTDNRGNYFALLMPPGRYAVEVVQEPFASQTHAGIQVTVGQVTKADFRMELLGPSTEVNVVAEVPIVETERSHQANTIDEVAIRELPIDRRDYLTYTLLVPGVVDSKALADSSDFRVTQTRDSGISFFGNNGRGNSVMADGAEANDFAGGVRETLSQDAVQEFQVNRSGYSAELGGASGGVINIVSKSGTNDFHGSVYGFLRHEKLDAADPFALHLSGDRLERIEPPSDRQQFGVTLGGPIARNKTFFFASFEGLQRNESNSVPVLTDRSIFEPTPAQEQILGVLPAPASAALRQVLTSPPGTRALFEENSGVFPFDTSSNKFSLRLDHSLDDSNQFMLRLNLADITETNPNTRALVGASRGFSTDILDGDSFVSWTHVASPTVVNQARFLFNYRNFFVSTAEKFGPEININGFGFFNRDAFLPSNTISRNYEFSDSLNIVRGAHNLKLGGRLLVRGIANDAFVFFGGRFFFGELPGALISPALASTSINGLQAFNLGLPQAYQQGFGDPRVGSTIPFFAGYVQDSWKLTPNLTLDLGIRYELDDRTDPVPTDTNNFAPRFAFAWDPFEDGLTTVRGGYGIFYSPHYYQLDFVARAFANLDDHRQIAQVFTTIQTPGAASAANIYRTLSAQGVITLPSPTRSITEADLGQFGISVTHDGPVPPLTVLFRNSDDFVNAYSQQASLGIERAINRNLSIGASYMFSRTLKIIRARDDNLLPAPVDPNLGIPVWSPQFFKQPLLFQDNVYESTGRAFYHGLVFEMTKRFADQFSLNLNYTFSKAIDEVVDFNSDFQATNQLDLDAERALSSFDQRHKLVMYGTLETPFETGRDAWEAALADISLTAILRGNSGRPFNLLVGADINGDRHSTTDRPPFAGRNTGLGPDFWTLDFRLSKRIQFGDGANISFIAEAFNTLNRLNFQSVNNTVGNIPGPFDVRGRKDVGPSQPLGFTSAFDPRRIQLGLRVTF
jgi:hypothetical protein